MSIRTHYDDKIARTEEEVQAMLDKQKELHKSVPKEKYVAVRAQLIQPIRAQLN